MSQGNQLAGKQGEAGMRGRITPKCTLTKFDTVDGRIPAPYKKPWNAHFPVDTNGFPWFQSGAGFCPSTVWEMAPREFPHISAPSVSPLFRLSKTLHLFGNVDGVITPMTAKGSSVFTGQLGVRSLPRLSETVRRQRA